VGEFSLFTMGRAQYVEAANTMTSCAVCMHYAPCGRLLSSLIRTLSSASLPLGQPFIRQCTTLLQVCDGQCRGLYWPHRTAHCAQRIRWGVLPGAFLVVRCVGSFMPVCVCACVPAHCTYVCLCVQCGQHVQASELPAACLICITLPRTASTGAARRGDGYDCADSAGAAGGDAGAALPRGQ
jgi:hypothetical protein